jgi:hypothetical protein
MNRVEKLAALCALRDALSGELDDAIDLAGELMCDPDRVWSLASLAAQIRGELGALIDILDGQS